MGFWGRRPQNSQAVGMYDPTRFDGDTTVFSAAEMTRRKILELTFNMNNSVSGYLSFKKLGKMPAMANEEAQASVQELFSLVRDSILVWMGERQKAIEKLKQAKNPDEKKIADMNADRDEDLKIFDALDELDRGSDANDAFLVRAKRFLNKYVYQRGISKLEIDTRDPIDDYAKQAYGDAYSEDG